MAPARFSQSELERHRKLLTDRLVALFNSVHADVRELEPAFVREDAGDEGDDAELDRWRHFYARLDERNAALAQAMEEALTRIGRGEFGLCIDCDTPIERERLAIIPWATRCVVDQERFEREQAPMPSTAWPRLVDRG
jgi:DnaK suppressor protein